MNRGAVERRQSVLYLAFAVLLRQREDAPALQRTAGGQLKREGRSGQAAGPGAFDGSPQHSAVAAVNAVKIAERHSTALRGVDGRQTLINLHWAVSPFRKIVFRP